MVGVVLVFLGDVLRKRKGTVPMIAKNSSDPPPIMMSRFFCCAAGEAGSTIAGLLSDSGVPVVVGGEAGGGVERGSGSLLAISSISSIRHEARAENVVRAAFGSAYHPVE